MRPWLKPALRRIWRDRETVQFGLGPAHAALVRTAGPAETAVLDLLDGTREFLALAAEAAALGVPEERVRALLDDLERAHALDDATAQRALGDLPPPERRRLSPDLAALSLVHPAPGAAPAVLAARRRAWVRVEGAGRIGAALAAQLAAAGVGRVDVRDAGRVAAEDASPGGLRPEDAGRLRETAAREAVRRATGAPPRSSPPPAGAVPSLVVVAPRRTAAAWAPDPELSRALVQSGTPHLYTGVLETVGSVGPFVLPGESPCGRCLSLHRADRDPTWPRVWAQLCSGRPGPPPACDGALAAATAALAALHALLLLDGGSPPSVGAVLEVSAADGAVRRRPVAAHPDCGCHWAPEESGLPAWAGERV